jgi:hypothetical protein
MILSTEEAASYTPASETTVRELDSSVSMSLIVRDMRLLAVITHTYGDVPKHAG